MVLRAASRRLLGVSGLIPQAYQGACFLASQSLRTSAATLAPPPPPKPVALSKLKDSFLDGTSSTYLEELEERYRSDPKSVDKSWASFFRSLGILLTSKTCSLLREPASLLSSELSG